MLVRVGKNLYALAQDTSVHFAFQMGSKHDTLLQQWWPDGERQLVKYTSQTRMTNQQLKAYTGEYFSPELDGRYTIVLKDHELVLTHPKYNDSKLQLLGRNDLLSDHWWMGHLTMLRNLQGSIVGFEVNDGRVMHLRFNKVK